jgi:hypothetical protein
MHEMVAKLRATTSSPHVSLVDDWNFSQKESRRALSNMIVQHGLPFSIVEYSGFIKFVKCLNPMFKMVSRTTIKEDCLLCSLQLYALFGFLLHSVFTTITLVGESIVQNLLSV